MIRGPWVSVWKHRLAAAVGRYNDANPNSVIGVPAEFDPATWIWGPYAEELARELKARNGVKNPNGLLDGDLRRLAAPVKVFKPDVIDVRGGGRDGFPTARPWQTRSTSGLFLVGHYTAGLSSFQNYARYHMDGHGWAFLSYHLGVDQAGVVYVFNDADDLTWHARGLNYKGVGVVFIGNEDGPNANQRRTLEWLVPRLLAGTFGYGYPPLGVMTTHRHSAAIDPGYATSCPGDNGEEFYRRLAGAAFRHDPRPLV